MKRIVVLAAFGSACGASAEEPLSLPPRGSICPAPSAVELGRVELGMEAGASVTLTSCGEATVRIERVSADVGGLEVRIDSMSALEPGESASLSIVARAESTGSSSGTIVVDHEWGPTIIPVSLEVVQPEGKVQITGFIPEAGVGQEIGGEVAILGIGFEAPAWNAATEKLTNAIMIDGHVVPLERYVLPRCSAERLVVTIPYAVDDGALGPDGRDVPVRVENENGWDVEDFRVLPPMATRPNPIIDPQTVVPPGIEGPTGTNRLDSGAVVAINGANFSPVAEENSVTIEVNGEELEMLGVTASSAGTRLTFTMPAALPTPLGNPTNGLLRVEVAGAAAPATANCLLFRTQ